MSQRRYLLVATALGVAGAVVFIFGTRTSGAWRVAGIWIGLGYLVGLIVLDRWLRRRSGDQGPQTHAIADVRWLAEAEGGRLVLPPGPVYWGTAVFAERQEEASEGVYFSVGLGFSEGGASSAEARPARVHFLALDLVRDRLLPGATFFVMEPPRPVAHAVVTRIYPQ